MLRAQSQVKTNELFKQRTSSAAYLTGHRLSVLMGETTPVVYEIGENVLVMPAEVNMTEEEGLREAQQQRLELQSLDVAQQALASQSKVARAANYPRLDAQGRANYANPNERFTPGDGKFHGTWDVSVMLSWTPTDLLGADASQAELHNQAQVLAAQRQELSEALRLEVASALTSVKTARFAVGAVQEQIEAAEEGYRTRRELFRAGRSTSVELIDSETELTRARLELVNAFVDLHIAEAQLAHALGRDQVQ